MKLRRMFVVLLVALCSTPALAQVKLERKIMEGSSYVMENTVKYDQTLSIAGVDQKSTVESRAKSKYEVGMRDFAGKLRVKEKIQSMQVSMNVGGSDFFFDSANPDNAGTSALEFARDVYKGMLHNVVTTVYDKDGTVVGVEFEKDLTANLSPEAKALVMSQFSQENLKRTANQELQRLPKEAVKAGDTWDRTEINDLGGGQVLTFHVRYTYEGQAKHDGKQLDKITSKVQSVKFELAADSPIPLKLKNSDLKVTESEGTLWFDREKGRVAEDSASVTIKGNLTFDFQGMELPAKLELTMRQSNKISD